MIFTITIDCDENGNLSSWAQVKERLTPEQMEKFKDLQRRIGNIVKPATTVGELQFTKKTTA